MKTHEVCYLCEKTLLINTTEKKIVWYGIFKFNVISLTIRLRGRVLSESKSVLPVVSTGLSFAVGPTWVFKKVCQFTYRRSWPLVRCLESGLFHSIQWMQ
jgi:hypothetical protein